MRLEDLRVDLRPRPPSQAVDLGFDLLRRHAGRAWAAWAVAWGALLILASPLALLPGGAFWSPLILWWIRPLPERIVVAILARGTFGQESSMREAFRALGREGMRGMGRFLTWGRPLGAGRCLRQPVWQLEGASAEIAGRRAAQLAAGGAGRSATAWGLACAHFECALTFGLLGLAGLFAGEPGVANPFAVVMALAEGEEAAGWVGILYWLSYGISAGIVAPVYTAGGFSLYLVRRSELEAWDIEIALRRLMRRVRRSSASLALVVLLLVGLASAPAEAAACPDSLLVRAGAIERAPTTDSVRLALRRAVDSLFRAEDIRPWECRKSWVAIPSDQKEGRNPPKMPAFLRTWAELLGAAAPILKWVAIGAFFGSLAYLVWRYRGSLLSGSGDAEEPLSAQPGEPVATAGPDLPAGIEETARSLWRTGDRRAALSLLYRAMLDRLDRSDRLPLSRGTTEGALLRRLAGRHGAAASAAREIARAWALAAWAGRWPDDAGFDRLVVRWRTDLEDGA